MPRTLLSKLERVFKEKQRQLYVAAMAVTRDRAAAEDAVYDALLAISELDREPDDLPAYLFRTVRNKSLHRIKQAGRFEADRDLAAFIDTGAQPPDQVIFAQQVLAGINTLEQDQQQVMIMKLFGELTFAEIAEITASNPNTVASWYRRGLTVLKERFNESAIR